MAGDPGDPQLHGHRRQLDVLVRQPDGAREWLELAECGLVAARFFAAPGWIRVAGPASHWAWDWTVP